MSRCGSRSSFRPNTPRPDALKATEPLFNTYALGWDVRDYRGAKIVWHGGAVFGFLTAVVLIPEKDVGFSFEINSEDGEIINGLMFELLDYYLGLPANGWPEKFMVAKRQRLVEALVAYKADRAKPAKVGPSLPLARYAGTHADPWYGGIGCGEIGRANGLAGIIVGRETLVSGRLPLYEFRKWQGDEKMSAFAEPFTGCHEFTVMHPPSGVQD